MVDKAKLKPKHIVIDARARQSSTGRYVDRLIEHLQHLDSFNKYTILLDPKDTWKTRSANFHIAQSHYRQFSLNPLEQIGFANQLYSLKPDLVHFSMTQQPVLYFGNIVTTTHDLTMFKFTRPKGRLLPIFWLMKAGYRFLFWWGHKKSKAIIVPSKYVQKQLAAYQPFTAEKLVLTYEASEKTMSHEETKPRNVKLPFILYVGSAFPHKNLPNLVDAFTILHQANPDLRLYFAGKPEYYYHKLDEHIAKSPAAENIKTLGFVEDSELKWLYNHAEAYIFPSLSEGFGLPGLEAMAHGCPVVSSDATCLPEIYGDAAHYFNPENPNDIAESIQTVLKSKELKQRLISAGHKRVKKYSWEKMAAQTLEVYQSLL